MQLTPLRINTRPCEDSEKAGVDLTDPAPYDAVSKIFNELMEEIERILDSAKV